MLAHVATSSSVFPVPSANTNMAGAIIEVHATVSPTTVATPPWATPVPSGILLGAISEASPTTGGSAQPTSGSGENGYDADDEQSGSDNSSGGADDSSDDDSGGGASLNDDSSDSDGGGASLDDDSSDSDGGGARL